MKMFYEWRLQKTIRTADDLISKHCRLRNYNMTHKYMALRGKLQAHQYNHVRCQFLYA